MTDGTRYDVCIVGAGPHALSVLSALRTPAALLKEHDHKRMAFNAAKAKVDKCLGPRVCVIDPAGKWMHEWNERFAGLDITYLRSPAWAHPDAFSQEALIDFAFQQNRLDELKEVDFQKTSLQGIPEVDSGYFRLPGTKLFHDFCKKHSARLPHDLVCGRVTDIRNVGSEYDYDIIFEGCPGSKTAKSVRAKQIVLALGAFGPPNIPTEFGCIFGLTDAQGCPRIVHTGNWRALKSLNEVLERPQRDVGRPVLVIGGGLSAVQAALLSVKHGRHTVLCSRRPLVERHYDLPLEWMDRRYADGGRGKKMFHFFAMSKTERLEYVKNIRGGGTVPPDYMQALQAARSKGLEILVNKVRTAVAVEGGVCVEFENGRVLTASYVVLGTGGMRDCTKWHDRISVVGSLAAGQLGPDAGNLTGARRGGAIVSDSIGVFEILTNTCSGALLSNTYAALYSLANEAEESDHMSSDEDQAHSFPSPANLFGVMKKEERLVIKDKKRAA